MEKPLDSALVWFRRDLRVDDHAALYHALKAARQVWCVFVFDTQILAPLPRADRRLLFLHQSVAALHHGLQALPGHSTGGLLVGHGEPQQLVPALAQALRVQAVFINHDDEPAALARDSAIRNRLQADGVALHSHKDHVVFERSEVLTQAGQPYAVFTPYKNAWLKKLTPFYLKAYPVARHAAALAPLPAAQALPAGVVRGEALPTLADLGFEADLPGGLKLPGGSAAGQALLADFLNRIDDYGQARDYPAVKGPSYLSTHLRFGTVSVRQLAREAWARSEAGAAGAATWLSELVWRDFYHQILHHHPRVVGAAFKPEYDQIRWAEGPQADAHFAAWCEGRTGYPLVDAAMAQINQTGYMHNRLRMVVASFLVKDLGLDWRRGEAYFAEKLLDFDLAANNGGWQWAASSGCDAQPYFRIFNPVSQSEKFDAQGRFIRRYLPVLKDLPDKALHAPWTEPVALAAAGLRLGRDYPEPVVDHAQARNQTLARYAVVKEKRGD